MKVAMVLEGGANRALFTAGVLDIMMQENIQVDTIVGVSAGALFGVNYFSGQRGRTIRYVTKYSKDKRYISYRNLILTGNIVNKDFAFYKLNKELDIFDNEAFINSKKEFYATATNVNTGRAEYLKITDPFKDMEKLRATSAVPLVSRLVKIGNNEYLDGAIANSIPIEKVKEYDKIIVILTQPLDYIKPAVDKGKLRAARIRYRKYQNFIKAFENRHITYNKTLEKIKKLEKEKKIFVIRPSIKINVNILEKDENKLKQVYNMGVKTGKEEISKLKKYLTED